MAGHVLVLSNSQNFGGRLLEHAEDWIRGVLVGARRVAIVPFARRMEDAAPSDVAQVFGELGLESRVVERRAMAAEGLADADAVFVVGGNTFRLLRDLYRYGVLEQLRAFTADGFPYIGASAGCNVACPTIGTTNDMPVTEPASFNALGIVPFQVNTHYIDLEGPERHMGETRLERLQDYAAENGRAVMGLPEGRALHLSAAGVALLGGGATVVSATGSSYRIAAGPLTQPVLEELTSVPAAPG